MLFMKSEKVVEFGRSEIFSQSGFCLAGGGNFNSSVNRCVFCAKGWMIYKRDRVSGGIVIVRGAIISCVRRSLRAARAPPPAALRGDGCRQRGFFKTYNYERCNEKKNCRIIR